METDENCTFCKIVQGEIPAAKIYEDEQVLAFLDIKPINAGHVLVISKKHAQLVSELDDESTCAIFKLAKKISLALVKSEVKCEAVNYYLADGETAGQEVPHVHLHIIPRFENDGFGLKFPLGYENLPAREELVKIAEQIKAEIISLGVK